MTIKVEEDDLGSPVVKQVLYKHLRKENMTYKRKNRPTRQEEFSQKREGNIFSKMEEKPIKYAKAMTPGQADYIRSISENQIVLCFGPAGSGKSAVPIITASQWLCEGKIKKILITRPISSTSSKSIGALPGELVDKYNPYLLPLIEELKKYFSHSTVNEYIENGVIELAPLELMRGRTFDDTFMCLDEASSCTFEQISMFLTRIGKNSKMVINGDFEQSDLKFENDKYGFMDCVDLLNKVPGIGIVELTEDDIVRSGIIKSILRALKNRSSLYKVEK